MKWTVQTPILTCDLSAPGDWFALQAKILSQMGIKDANPVLTEADATKVADKAARAHAQAASKITGTAHR